MNNDTRPTQQSGERLDDTFPDGAGKPSDDARRDARCAMAPRYIGQSRARVTCRPWRIVRDFARDFDFPTR